jgi:DNA-binding transcriptional MerR regulator
MAQDLTIGALAKRASTKVQTIRFYEDEGLMPAPARSEGGQRRYAKAHADRLAFIRLLKLVDRPDQPCAEVDRVARDVLADVEAKIARLESLRGELQRMVRQCRHGRVSDCRVIKVLADHSHSNCLSRDHGH